MRASIAAAGFCVAVVAAAGAWLPPAPLAPGPRDVMLLYVGADDCAPCRAWQRADGPAFRSAPEFSRVNYREVKSPSVLDIMKDDNWPDDLRRYRERMRGAAVPLWLVVADDVVVEQAFGPRQWREAVLPKLRSLVR